MDQLRADLPSLSTNDSDDKVFCYLVANMFDTIDEDAFHYTDGPNDLGIDFYTQDGEDFRIYQCKSIDSDANPKGKTFDETPVNEIAAAIDYLIDGNRKASSDVQRLRASYQLNVEEHSLTAVLAIEGRLSPSAEDRFHQIRDTYKNKHVDIRLIDEQTIFNAWHELDELKKPQDVSIDLQIIGNGLMKMNGWFCAVASIKSFIKAMESYGKGLFDLNVRANLKSSKVNAAIKRTISTAKGQKQFIHLNNGLVIICNNYSFSSNSTSVRIKGAQVINGCQTLSTLWDYYFHASKAEKEELLSNLNILVKVIDNTKVSKDNLLDDIIVASNNQNPMNERNLKSNSIEQRQIQAHFYQPPLRPQLRYFYIRKDGEFDAFLDGVKVREPKKKYFEISGSAARKANKYRHIENTALAKMWWSWIGNGSAVNAGSVDYFGTSTYTHIFEERPSYEAWEAAALPDYQFDEKLLESRPPTQFQYLACMALSSYLGYRAKPENMRQFKKERIQQLIDSKTISQSSSKQEIDNALADDADYTNTNWLSQMSYILTDISAFVLVNKYGALTSETCRKLIDLGDMSYWLEHGMNRKYISDDPMHNGLLERLFEFVWYAATSFFTLNRNAILLANRPKLYLGKNETIRAIKQNCLKQNKDFFEYPTSLKPAKVTFLDSFPSI